MPTAGSAPLLVATVELLRGRRVIGRRTVSRTRGVRPGVFSLPVALGRLPKGVRLSLRVLLIDQSIGLPTASRTLTL